MDPLSSIKSYATLHHVIRKGQLYGVVPYTHHLAEVERVFREFGENRLEMLQAAWAHDLIEDTDVKRRDLEENFGPEVADLVWAVTSEDGQNRKIRNALTYPKIRGAGFDAIRLKLADRIANTRGTGGSLDMYRKEYPDFRHALYTDGTENHKVMWNCLDKIMEWK